MSGLLIVKPHVSVSEEFYFKTQFCWSKRAGVTGVRKKLKWVIRKRMHLKAYPWVQCNKVTTNLSQTINTKLSVSKKKNHTWMWNALWKLFAPWSDNCSSFPDWWSRRPPCMSFTRLADCTWHPEYWSKRLSLAVSASYHGSSWCRLKNGISIQHVSLRTSTDLSKVAVKFHESVGSLCKIKLPCSFSQSKTGSVWIFTVLTVWSHHVYLWGMCPFWYWLWWNVIRPD